MIDIGAVFDIHTDRDSGHFGNMILVYGGETDNGHLAFMEKLGEDIRHGGKAGKGIDQGDIKLPFLFRHHAENRVFPRIDAEHILADP